MFFASASIAVQILTAPPMISKDFVRAAQIVPSASASQIIGATLAPADLASGSMRQVRAQLACRSRAFRERHITCDLKETLQFGISYGVELPLDAGFGVRAQETVGQEPRGQLSHAGDQGSC